jgi:RNA polymerase sigma-70 factor (ECF subfamily)
MYPSKLICEKYSDAELVMQSKEQVDFFSCLYDRYEKQLLRYVRRMGIVSDEEAEDILQESYFKIWKNLNAFDPSLKFSSWIYRIVHNQAISCLRKKKAFGRDQTSDFNEEKYAESAETDEMNVPEILQEKERNVQDTLNILPQKYREVLILRYFEDMSYEEISDVLKIPEGTVATRIRRAKNAFRSKAEPILSNH